MHDLHNVSGTLPFRRQQVSVQPKRETGVTDALYLPRQWFSNVRQKLRMGRTIDLEVIPCFCEAQLAVDRPPDHIGIAIILPIILPPAHRAQSV